MSTDYGLEWNVSNFGIGQFRNQIEFLRVRNAEFNLI